MRERFLARIPEAQRATARAAGRSDRAQARR